jgi:hypothetical protein
LNVNPATFRYGVLRASTFGWLAADAESFDAIIPANETNRNAVTILTTKSLRSMGNKSLLCQV